jgi:hypothetical protein
VDGAATMLGLKLLLVPLLLGLLTLAGRKLGAAVTGFLAGLPLVSGPITLILALEQGAAFAASAAVATVTAVVAAAGFGLAYAHAAQRHAWPLALAAGLAAWLTAAAAMAWWRPGLMPALGLALTALALAVRCYPRQAAQPRHGASRSRLRLTMAAGALLTLCVAELAGLLGGAWSGLLALFPLLGSMLAVCSHRDNGSAFTAVLLQGMARGMLPLVGFFAVLALLLPRQTVAQAFGAALLACLLLQLAAMRPLRAGRLSPRRQPVPTPAPASASSAATPGWPTAAR